jgi:hypothetical protein
MQPMADLPLLGGQYFIERLFRTSHRQFRLRPLNRSWGYLTVSMIDACGRPGANTNVFPLASSLRMVGQSLLLDTLVGSTAP